jgi:Ca-activated chloride channel family protein
MMIDFASMTFLWPGCCGCSSLVPAFVAAYLWLLARGRKVARATRTSRWAAKRRPAREHPAPRPGRPAAARLERHAVRGRRALMRSLTLPARQETVILAMDVSGSMRATDIKPNRLAAAQASGQGVRRAAAAPRPVSAWWRSQAQRAVVQSPTDNREDIVQAIDRFQLSAVPPSAAGLLMSLCHADAERGHRRRAAHLRPSGAALDADARKAEDWKAVPPGSNGSAAIVLLSDGEANTGFDPMEAAKMAPSAACASSPVGVGTKEGHDDRLRRLVDARAAERGRAEENRHHHRGRVLPGGHAPDLTAIYKRSRRGSRSRRSAPPRSPRFRGDRRRVRAPRGAAVDVLVQPNPLRALSRQIP